MTVQTGAERDEAGKALAPAPEGAERMKERMVYHPRVDIYEDEKAITLVADVPGVAREDVEITLEKRTLTLHAKTKPQDREGYSLVYAEYEEGDFERSFVVSEEIDPDAIAAKVCDGVLAVTLPKRAPSTRRIAIAAG